MALAMISSSLIVVFVGSCCFAVGRLWLDVVRAGGATGVLLVKINVNCRIISGAKYTFFSIPLPVFPWVVPCSLSCGVIDEVPDDGVEITFSFTYREFIAACPTYFTKKKSPFLDAFFASNDIHVFLITLFWFLEPNGKDTTQ